MKAVAGGALALGCAVFVVLALGSIAAFGAVDANILNNLSASGMAPLIGDAPAQARQGGCARACSCAKVLAAAPLPARRCHAQRPTHGAPCVSPAAPVPLPLHTAPLHHRPPRRR
jgi:hypothetical protein